MPVFTGDSPRHFDFNTMRTTHLFTFHRHRHRAAEDNQVIEHPHQAYPHGEGFIRRAVHIAPDPKRHAHQIQQDEEDIRAGDNPVDVLLFHQATLSGDVEFAFVRVKQRDHRRWRDVPREHRFIDFTPEGVAVFALNF